MKARQLLAAAYVAAFTLTSGLHAADWLPIDGWYVSGMAGASLKSAAKVAGSGVTAADVEMKFDPGYNASLAGGARMWKSYRGEVELSWRENSTDSLNKAATGISYLGSTAVDGSLRAYGAMFNAYWDVSYGSMWQAYIGAGAGVNGYSFEQSTHRRTNSVFAAQGIVGATYEVMPTWLASVDYRFVSGKKPEFTDVDGDKYTIAAGAHLINLGIRKEF